jgi:hypothetical protein
MILNQGFLLVKLKSSLRKFYGRHHDLVDRYGISVSQMNVPLVLDTSRSFPHSWFITGFVTILIRRVSLVEQELLILPKHLSSPSVLSEVRVTQSLVLCVSFVDRCLFFCTFSFGHCFVSSSWYSDSDYLFGIFWPLFCLFFLIFGLPLWYLLAIVLSILLDIRIRITSLVSFGHCFAYSSWYLDYDYLPLVSSNFFWLLKFTLINFLIWN